LLAVKEEEDVTYFNLQKYMNRHFVWEELIVIKWTGLSWKNKSLLIIWIFLPMGVNGVSPLSDRKNMCQVLRVCRLNLRWRNHLETRNRAVVRQRERCERMDVETGS
jgi:hypothetical protein